jgi:hypothetical protein
LTRTQAQSAGSAATSVRNFGGGWGIGIGLQY